VTFTAGLPLARHSDLQQRIYRPRNNCPGRATGNTRFSKGGVRIERVSLKLTPVNTARAAVLDR
jgi:hypothetical protein